MTTLTTLAGLSLSANAINNGFSLGINLNDQLAIAQIKANDLVRLMRLLVANLPSNDSLIGTLEAVIGEVSGVFGLLSFEDPAQSGLIALL